MKYFLLTLLFLTGWVFADGGHERILIKVFAVESPNGGIFECKELSEIVDVCGMELRHCIDRQSGFYVEKIYCARNVYEYWR